MLPPELKVGPSGPIWEYGVDAVSLERACYDGRGRLVVVVSGFYGGSGDLRLFAAACEWVMVAVAYWAREG
ncbi:hypothetical protein TIFTF001_005894 [Ficus carica]|uniref:Uncharacterized protein n=1 Tax=Ficus carica TaxID=3494 RepID=A0AA87ZLQ1_FICCA|nr:hypothetical protein TIFTF001_005894 [Ficus carica]